MALPSSYTEGTLKTYMLAVLAELATVLGLTSASFDEAVNDVLIAYGVDDIAAATDVARLRSLAQVAAYRRAQTVAAGWYDFSADGGDFKRSQLLKQIGALLAGAEREALNYVDTYSIQTGTLTWTGDPYVFGDDDDSDDSGV